MPPPVGLGAAILAECARYPQQVVNRDLVAAQIVHETAAWQSEYARLRNNPGGIGAINSDPDKALYFDTVADGIRAHVAHLLVYAVGDGPWTSDDDRREAMDAAEVWRRETLNLTDWRMVGAASRWVDLNGRWAYPGTTYAQQIVGLADRLEAFMEGWQEPMTTPRMISGLVDIRHLLATASGANRGPTERLPLSQKRGVVVHYRGVVTPPAPGYATFQADARYHVSKNWASAGQPPVYGTGIMYHLGIGSDGTAYQLRDLDRVLWHCGAWPHNAETLAIQIPIGGNQRATAAQLTTLQRVVDEWCAATGTPRASVWGHQELSGSDCPGTLMTDFVLPYRAGKDEPDMDDGHFFHETGHYVGGGFWTYWQTRGGLQIFGYPLTDELRETVVIGMQGDQPITREVTVQYFERAVLEYHPQNAAPYDILLRRLGADALAARAA